MGTKSDYLVGLDIGTTKICAVVGEPTHQGINIIGIGMSPSTGLREGVVINIEQTVQSIKKALEEAELMAGCQIREVYAGIAGSHINGLNSHGIIAVKGGEISQKDKERVIDATKAVSIPLDRELIHILPQEYIVDDQRGVDDLLGMAGVRLEIRVHIVTGAISSAQNIVRSCHKSGLDVTDIVLESLASARAVLTEDEQEIGVALVDIGGGTTDISVFSKESIKHNSVIALGGTNLTSDIAFGLRTSISGAEKIKVKYSCALADKVQSNEVIDVPNAEDWETKQFSRRVLAEICEPRIEEILIEANKELERSGYKDMIGAGVVLTGGTSLIEEISELGKQVFELPTRVGYPKGVGGLKDVVMNPKYSTAVGLLQYSSWQQKSDHREKNIFNWILSSMRKWFSDIS